MVALDDMSVILEVMEQTNTNDKATSKNVKKVKDQNVPKQALNLYIFFMSKNCNLIKASMPLTEVGPQWRGLAEDKKVKYLEMVNKDKERYVRRWRSTLPKRSKNGWNMVDSFL